jgi:hypothetical protein
MAGGGADIGGLINGGLLDGAAALLDYQINPNVLAIYQMGLQTYGND